MGLVTDAPVAGNSESRLLYRFPDLKRLGIVNNYTTLLRWIDQGNFPAGRMLGANSRAWLVSEIEDWIASRPVGGA
jgi:predicted DNA-binding transcriptional regulator AlpA